MILFRITLRKSITKMTSSTVSAEAAINIAAKNQEVLEEPAIISSCQTEMEPTSLLSKGRKRFPSPDVRVPEKRKKVRPENVLDMKLFEGVKYYFESGLRKVEPYYFTWKTYAKGRWIGKTVEEVFREEFYQVCEEVTKSRLYSKPSNIFVNGIRVDVSQKIKNNDFIAHYTHRHEMPVSGEPIKIIAETDDMLVIDKPASIPAHPCGRFRMNSAQFILAKEHGLNNLRMAHRLDRLTSGLMIFSKNLATSQAVTDQMLDRSVLKEYLCQVRGAFPESPVVCQAPIDCVNKRIGIYKVKDTGRECVTEFERLSYDETINASIVLCRPKTGRTHQIRVHLQHLGYPIINDPLYGPDPKVDLNGAPVSLEGFSSTDLSGGASELIEDERLQFSKLDELPGYHWIDEECPECWIDFKDPTPEELRIDLHCWKYEGPGWKFETELPIWAQNVRLKLKPLVEESSQHRDLK